MYGISRQTIRKLKKVQSKSGIPDSSFGASIVGAPAITTKVQHNVLLRLLEQNQDAPIRELYGMLLVERFTNHATGTLLVNYMEIANVIRSVNSFEELVQEIVRIEDEHFRIAEKPEWLLQAEAILEEEHGSKVAPALDLIKNVEKHYADLYRQNPHQDGHWLLANTWLKRYGNSAQAVERGAEWTEFIALKDTMQFSVLEFPASVRALALFLVYKELAPKYSLYYWSDFHLLMEEVFRLKENRQFYQMYKFRNPQTFARYQQKTGGDYDVYWLLKGLEFEEQSPDLAEVLFSKFEPPPGK
mgnify:FL=1